jgi:hypothetical protein
MVREVIPAAASLPIVIFAVRQRSFPWSTTATLPSRAVNGWPSLPEMAQKLDHYSEKRDEEHYAAEDPKLVRVLLNSGLS